MSRRPKLATVPHSPVGELSLAYREAGDFDSRLNVARKYAYSLNPSVRDLTGELLLDLAFQTPNPSERLTLIEESEEVSRSALQLAKNNRSRDSINHFTTGTAELRLAQSNLYRWRALNPEHLPPNSEIKTSYEQTVTAGIRHVRMMNGEEGRRTSNGVRFASTAMAGHIAEEESLALAQRYSISLSDSSWLALHSRYSQDAGNAQASGLKSAWDINVYTQLDQATPPDLTYKVQVSARRKEGYVPDIVMLSVCDDLELPDERNLNRQLVIGRIMTELAIELEGGSRSVSARLDSRTEQLLDVLG